MSETKQWKPSIYFNQKMVVQQRCLFEGAKHPNSNTHDHNSRRKSVHPWKTSYDPDRNFCVTTVESLALSQNRENVDFF